MGIRMMVQHAVVEKYDIRAKDRKTERRVATRLCLQTSNPAGIGITLSPVALRPRLSTSLPINRVILSDIL